MERSKFLHKAVKRAFMGAGALGAWALASGFPTRMGLTRAQALVSMPGDLVLPTAHLQADRAGQIQATPEEAWGTVYDIVGEYEDLWGAPLEPIYEEVPKLLVVRTPEPGKDEDPMAASLAITFAEGVDGETNIHVRERYIAEDLASRIKVSGLMKRSYLVSRLWLRAARKALATNGRA